MCTPHVIQPWLKLGVIAPPSDPELGWAWPKLVNVDDDPPPLRWLEAATPEGNVQDSHEYRWTKWSGARCGNQP